VDGFYQWPWLADEDAKLIKSWYRTDPVAAKQYLNHLWCEAQSDNDYRDNTLPLEALGDAA
jgi:hypothetical protein